MTDQPSISDGLLELVRNNKRHLWIGEMPPFDFVSVNIFGCTNFRISPAHHQQYDVVWYYQHMPSDLLPDKFELVLDELIRAIGLHGKLVIRYRQNEQFSVILLKHFLGRKYNTTIDIDSESISSDGTFVTVFDVRRNNLQIYQDRKWSFAILTQGKKVDNVVRFLTSVRSYDKNQEHEILIVGPCDSAYDSYGVNYLQRSYRENLAEICRKKNDIVAAASHENLLIVHDRYVLDDNFFSGFETFGYDFDYATILQWYTCGTRFPGYAAMTSSDLVWSPPIDCTDYSSAHPSAFINGGLIVAKRQALKDIPFNNMLFWNQAEDVELAREFRNRGIPPRVNCFSSATTLGITPLYTKAFETEVVVRKDDHHGHPVSFGKKLERKVRPYLKRLIRKTA